MLNFETGSNQRQMTDSEVERAWAGGPLRRIGSGNGLPSKYVCEVCRRSVIGVFFVKPRQNNQEHWVCEVCKPSKVDD
jgi:hypothetical protein